MGKRKIIFRADGNSEIGLGHIMRSLALAEMLRDSFICEFATRFITPFIRKEINRVCEKIYSLQKRENLHFDHFLSLLTGNEIVVLDNYFFDTEYQRKIKNLGCKLVCIDDLADKHFVADIIFNHSPGIKAEDYSYEDYTNLALGYKYSLLRKPFFEIPQVNKNLQYGFSKIILTLGGSENSFLINKFLGFLDSTDIKEIVLLSDAKDVLLDSLSKKILIKPKLDAFEMVRAFDRANLAVLPSSTLCLEAISRNIPIITGYFVENQKLIYKGLSHNPYISNIGDMNQIDKETFLSHYKEYENTIKTSFVKYGLIDKEVQDNIKDVIKHIDR